jgi:hypothetical protein
MNGMKTFLSGRRGNQARSESYRLLTIIMKHGWSHAFYKLLLFLQPLNSLDRCQVSLWCLAGYKPRCLSLGLNSLYDCKVFNSEWRRARYKLRCLPLGLNSPCGCKVSPWRRIMDVSCYDVTLLRRQRKPHAKNPPRMITKMRMPFG